MNDLISEDEVMYGTVKYMDSLLLVNFHDCVIHLNNLHVLMMVLKQKFDS